jgi:hypothetical protein
LGQSYIPTICPAGSCTSNCANPTPWEFQHRAERFLPPYFFGTSRPDIVSLSATELRYGATVDVTYRGEVTDAVLMTPAAVTHQVSGDGMFIMGVFADCFALLHG